MRLPTALDEEMEVYLLRRKRKSSVSHVRTLAQKTGQSLDWTIHQCEILEKAKLGILQRSGSKSQWRFLWGSEKPPLNAYSNDELLDEIERRMRQ